MEPNASLAVQPSALEQRPQTIVRACDMCRKKKIRCEPTAPGCAQCTKYGTSCRFTPIAVKKKPRRPAGFRYIAQLEGRLTKMEELLGDQLSGKPSMGSTKEQTIPGPSLNTEALGHSHGEIGPGVSKTIPLITSPQQTGNTRSDLSVALQGHGNGETHLSRLGEDTTDRLARNLCWHITPDLGPFSLPATQQLPTKTVALELVKETFSGYNKFVPLFDEEEFLQEFQLKYTTSNPGDPSWWACLNIVLSLAHRLRALRTLDQAHENTQADGYLQNALAVVSVLTVSYQSLSAVQALVGLAYILQGTPNPEPASVFTAAALRLAQNMNMHREIFSPGLTTSQVEQRKRVFWLAYILDKDVSLRMERPFSQDDDDMDVQLPSKTRCDTSEDETENCAVDLLNYRIGLAVIQGQVYKRLYSIQARRQVEPQRAIAAQELHSALSYWKSIAQPESPEESTTSPGFQLSGEMVHKVVLRLTYIHCLAMIDRHLPPVMGSSSDQDLSQSDLLPLSGSVCLAESRKTIRLLEAIPHGDCACVWMLLHAFFAAASSILHNLTWNPRSPQANSDLHLVKPFLSLLESLAGDQNKYPQSEGLRKMNRVCNNLNNEAWEAVKTFSI